MSQVISFAGVALLVCALVLSHYCRRFTVKIQRMWQALSAGVTVAYVFINVIPELEEHRPIVAGSATGSCTRCREANLPVDAGRFCDICGAEPTPSPLGQMRHEPLTPRCRSGAKWRDIRSTHC